MFCPNPIHCILPPYVLDKLAESSNAKLRRMAVESIARSAHLRAQRTTIAQFPAMAAIPSPAAKKHRLVYDAGEKGASFLPGELVREEGGAKSKDTAVNEAYDHSGTTYDFYKTLFNRNSLDDKGMSLLSSVHVGRKYNNAFWNGEQMAYGDGDGELFIRFTKSLDVVGHELSHGVVSHTCISSTATSRAHSTSTSPTCSARSSNSGSASRAQPGPTGSLVPTSWVQAPPPGRCARSRGSPPTKTIPFSATTLNPSTSGTVKGTADSGGVHINSGIPNHAFYRLAMALGGNAWDKPGTDLVQDAARAELPEQLPGDGRDVGAVRGHVVRSQERRGEGHGKGLEGRRLLRMSRSMAVL